MFSVFLTASTIVLFMAATSVFQSGWLSKGLIIYSDDNYAVNQKNQDKIESIKFNNTMIVDRGDISKLVLLSDNGIQKTYRGAINDYQYALTRLFDPLLLTQYFIGKYGEKKQMIRSGQVTSESDGIKKGCLRDVGNQSNNGGHLVLVVAQSRVMQPLYSNQPMNIAIVNHYPSVSFIKKFFPHAKVESFQSLYSAMLTVTHGKNDYFIGSSLAVGHSIENDFNHFLKIIKHWPADQQENHFLTCQKNNYLTELGDFTSSKDSDENFLYPKSQAVISDYLLSFNKTVLFNEQESAWIAKNPNVTILINPYFMPFTLPDENGDIRGVVGDILNLVTLQTGLNFQAVTEKSNKKIAEIITKGNWDLVPVITYGESHTTKIDFSDPFLSSHLVAVVKSQLNTLSDLGKEAKIAAPASSVAVEWLKENYPLARVMLVENSSVAIALLNDGQVDAAVSNQLTADYMIAHYYPDKLTYFLLPTEMPVQIGFSVPKGNEILLSIINKTLSNISRSEVNRLTREWIETPNIKIDTWEIYREPFYYVIIISGFFIVSTLFWGGCLLREIHQRKKTQQDLEYQLNLRNTLSDAIPMPLYWVSLDGRLLNYNNAFSLFFTHQRESVFSDNLNHPEHPIYDIYLFLLKNLVSSVQDKSVHVHQFELSDGTEKRSLLHWSTFCIMPSNKDPLIICGWQDITDSVRLMRALQREKDKAIDASQAKSAFLSRMSHEIRTPVSAVIGFLELLATQQQSPEETKKAIQIAYDTSRSLLSLIGDVLDMEKIESGHFHLAPCWVCLSTIIQDVVMMFDALSRQKQIALSHINETDDEIYLWLDPQAIKQILINLVSNALKFIKHGTIEIHTEITKVNTGYGLLSIRVIDTGPGISEEEQKKLFRPFSQAKAGRLQTGSGLGLVICQELLSFMQGEISMSSQPGRGTTFLISVPVEMAEGKGCKQIAAVDDVDLPKALSILITDDHPVNRMLLRSQLSSLGYQSDEASNGLEALALIEIHSYDLLIVDVNMPEMDGLSLTRAIRKFNHHMIIWGLTANAQQEDREAALESGMDICLFKPLSLAELKHNLANLTLMHSTAVRQGRIDIALLEKQMLGNTELIKTMLILAQQENRRDLSLAQQACQESNRPALDKALHRMKGSVQILGAPDLLSLIKNTERQLVEGSDFQLLEKSLDDIEKELLLLERFIKDYLDKHQP